MLLHKARNEFCKTDLEKAIWQPQKNGFHICRVASYDTVSFECKNVCKYRSIQTLFGATTRCGNVTLSTVILFRLALDFCSQGFLFYFKIKKADFSLLSRATYRKRVSETPV